MKEKNHLALLNNYRSQINKLWIGLFICLFSIGGLVFKILTTETAEKTIVTPASFNKPFTVEGNEYSASYKEQMSTYLLQLLLNYQPRNVKYQFNEFLQYVHPTKAEQLNSKLNAELKKIAQKKTSSVFYPTNIKVEDNDVYVTGKLVGMVGRKVVTDETKIYKITYNTENGFYVLALSEVIKKNDNFEEIIEDDINLLNEE